MNEPIDMNGQNAWEVPEFDVFPIRAKSTKYCVCIPVINEGDRLKEQLSQMAGTTGLADVIILDGGSTDGSTDIHSLEKAGVAALLVKRGPGKLGAQLRMGYSYALKAGYDGIITIDGNNKDNVSAIPDFIRELDSGTDFVQGSRFISGGRAVNTPLERCLAIRLIHAPFVSFLAGFRYTDTTNGFRAYSKGFLLDPGVLPFRNIFSTYELLPYLAIKAPKLGFKTKEIPVERRYPEKGKMPTKISFLRGNLDLIRILFALFFKQYDPKK